MNTLRKQLGESLSLTRTAEDGGFSASLALPDSFVGFQGHFPGNPVVPGVCLVQAVLLAAERVLGKPVRLDEVKVAKFFSPLLAGQVAEIVGNVAAVGATAEVAATLTSAGRKVAHVSLRAVVASPGGG